MYGEDLLSTSIREAHEEAIGEELLSALEKRGFERLTPVQEAMLAPELSGRDLRISSQTGSGKTIAIGLAIRDEIRAPKDAESDDAEEESRDNHAHPRAMVVTPTRELAKQVEEELSWFVAPLGALVVSVTGGAGYRDELRSFRRKPAIIVGTPGRLLDHLNRGSVAAESVATIVLDEADRMLDLGFREDLEAILKHAPAAHRTHLVSATFPREVRALADRVQKNPVAIEGTPLGTANLDIEHLVHLVQANDRVGAIVNLLLEKPGSPALIFARTRANVAGLADELAGAGFTIAMLSGEMEQPERTRALAAFKRGGVDALVATDVAARGIDVQEISRVIHAEPPDDADAYTHRSGRTGRAGKKGTSSVLVMPNEIGRITGLLGRAKVRYRFAPIPSADSIRENRDERLFEGLAADFVEGETIDARSLELAERILGSLEPARAVGRLVALTMRHGQAEPRSVAHIEPPSMRQDRFRDAPARDRFQSEGGFGGRAARPQREQRGGDFREQRGGDFREQREPREPRESDGSFVPFRVSWGESHGADPRRLVAMMCRRGNIEGRDIGAIRVGRTSSVIDVSAKVAAQFEEATAKPDPRDPRVHVRRWSEEPTKKEYAAPKERPAPIPKERPSRAIPKERPSVPKDAIPKERPSRAVPKDRPSVPKDRPSKAIPKDKPSIPKERASKAVAAKPKAGPTRGAPKPQRFGGGGKPKPWQGGSAPPKRRGPR